MSGDLNKILQLIKNQGVGIMLAYDGEQDKFLSGPEIEAWEDNGHYSRDTIRIGIPVLHSADWVDYSVNTRRAASSFVKSLVQEGLLDAEGKVIVEWMLEGREFPNGEQRSFDVDEIRTKEDYDAISWKQTTAAVEGKPHIRHCGFRMHGKSYLTSRFQDDYVAALFPVLREGNISLIPADNSHDSDIVARWSRRQTPEGQDWKTFTQLKDAAQKRRQERFVRHLFSYNKGLNILIAGLHDFQDETAVPSGMTYIRIAHPDITNWHRAYQAKQNQ